MHLNISFAYRFKAYCTNDFSSQPYTGEIMNKIQKQQILDKHIDLLAELYLQQIVDQKYPDWVENDEDCLQYNNYSYSLENAAA